MKKLLLLMPLLAACAPSISKPLDFVGPFKVGQTLRLSSMSKIDKMLPLTSIFVIKNILLEGGSYSIEGVNLIGGIRTRIDALFYFENGGFSVIDPSTLAAGAVKLRFCVFTDIDFNRSPYTGFAAHLTQNEFASNTKALASSLSKYQTISGQSMAKAAVQILAFEDNSPCTLELVQ